MTDSRLDVEDESDSTAYSVGRVAGYFLRAFIFVAGGVIVAADAFPAAIRGPLIVGLAACGLLVFFGLIFVRSAAFAFAGLYVLAVAVGAHLQKMEPRPVAALIAVTIASVVAALGFMMITIRVGRARKELERVLFHESTSLAFFVTMIGAVTYALLESWIDAPRLSMWVVWTVGMMSWAALSEVFRRMMS